MTLAEALEVLENTDFQGLDPEALQALSVVMQAASSPTRAEGTQQGTQNRVVETSTD